MTQARSIFFSLFKNLFALTLFAFGLSENILAQALPAEKKIAQIIRRADSGQLLIDNLSVNLNKTITVQVPYIEQVPYQAEETYIETVPYQIQVPYTEYITDYRQEQRCNNVTRYRQECRNERQCYRDPGSGQNCRYVEECGTNVHGQRICKTRQVCTNNPPRERCDYRQVCYNVPYTDRECSYVQVPYQREVTRYRTETRYRQETRTRTVTRYRQEQRCCRPETQVVFDRQLQYQLEVHFPSEAILTPNQIETLNIILVSATEQSAQVQLQPLNTIYSYTIANQTVSGSIIRVELAATPKRILSEPDLASLSDSKKLNVELAGAGSESALLITDATLDFEDVQTVYAIFLDLNTDEGNKPLNTRTFTRAQLKESGGFIRMADVIQNPTAIREALIPGNTIVYSVIAKRSGSSSLLAGRTLKAQKLSSFVLQ